MSDEPEWFLPTRYGYGSGLPIAWQGWALILGYIAVLAAASLLIPHSLVVYAAVVVSITIILFVICARTTRGGWRWRWGDPD